MRALNNLIFFQRKFKSWGGEGGKGGSLKTYLRGQRGGARFSKKRSRGKKYSVTGEDRTGFGQALDGGGGGGRDRRDKEGTDEGRLGVAKVKAPRRNKGFEKERGGGDLPRGRTTRFRWGRRISEKGGSAWGPDRKNTKKEAEGQEDYISPEE